MVFLYILIYLPDPLRPQLILIRHRAVVSLIWQIAAPCHRLADHDIFKRNSGVLHHVINRHVNSGAALSGFAVEMQPGIRRVNILGKSDELIYGSLVGPAVVRAGQAIIAEAFALHQFFLCHQAHHIEIERVDLLIVRYTIGLHSGSCQRLEHCLLRGLHFGKSQACVGPVVVAIPGQRNAVHQHVALLPGVNDADLFAVRQLPQFLRQLAELPLGELSAAGDIESIQTFHARWGAFRRIFLLVKFFQLVLTFCQESDIVQIFLPCIRVISVDPEKGLVGRHLFRLLCGFCCRCCCCCCGRLCISGR